MKIQSADPVIYISSHLYHDDAVKQRNTVMTNKRQKIILQQKKIIPTRNHSHYTFDNIVGTSDEMVDIINRAKIASKSASSMLIYGESGTGKELLAQSIHSYSNRCNKPFIPLNCAAIPETLIEGELFGYEDGAFTGARKGGAIGKIESANSGTLFLDEIGDMPLQAQVKLLRVIQERKLLRLGATTEIPIDIRIIAATHKDLRGEMVLGHFRKDLYYRLNVLTIHIPALRNRTKDLPELVKYFVAKYSSLLGKPDLLITDSFMESCYAYSWPGNVRELENVIERAVNMVDKSNILSADLMELDLDYEMANSPISIPSIQDMERELLIRALKRYYGNILHVSNALGMSRGSIYRKIKKYNIDYTISNPLITID